MSEDCGISRGLSELTACASGKLCVFIKKAAKSLIASDVQGHRL
jgi:hypothetical protein